MKLPALLADHFDTLGQAHIEECSRILAGDFSVPVKSDLITQCFLDNDPILFDKALPWLRDSLKQASFMDSILRLQRKQLEAEMAQFCCDPSYYRHQIESKERELGDLCESTLQEQARKSFDSLCLSEAAKDFTAAQCKENYYLASLLRIIYEVHCAEQRELNRFKRSPQRSTPLYRYYEAAGNDLFKTDQQYSKYNLYSITAGIELMLDMPCRIFDTHSKLQLFIENTPRHVLKLFERLRRKGLIEDLALLAGAQTLIETDQYISIALGVEEILLPLTLYNLPRQVDGEVLHTVVRTNGLPIEGTAVIPSVSTFREPGSEDMTWCSITADSMTFEEIAHVPELLDDCAVTRMIHLEYFVVDSELYVSHVDHEFIFYTHEEFDLRSSDPSQKGNARKRLKTFKIDRSNIPFVLEDGTLFVHTLIDACFERPGLLMDFLRDMLLPQQ